MAWHNRLFNLFRTHRIARDIDREMSFHVQERADELMAHGYSETDAMREAKRRFGNELMQKEQTRDADILRWIETFGSDVRYALRALFASPVFAVIAILSLALGIGANTAIFSLINAVMLKSLPVQRPEELMQVTFSNKKDADGTFTNPLWEAVRDRQDIFSGAFAYGNGAFDLSEGGVVHSVDGYMVSGDFFNTLGVRPEAGRLIAKSDDFRGCTGAVVISYSLWQSQFGGAASAIGSQISLQGHRFPIIGVADRKFFGVDVGSAAQAYLPLCAEAITDGPNNMLDARSSWWLHVIGRPKVGVTPSGVRARLATLAPAAYAATVPPKWKAEDQAKYKLRTLIGARCRNGHVESAQ